jgi:hypothetical protein
LHPAQPANYQDNEEKGLDHRIGHTMLFEVD